MAAQPIDLHREDIERYLPDRAPTSSKPNLTARTRERDRMIIERCVELERGGMSDAGILDELAREFAAHLTRHGLAQITQKWRARNKTAAKPAPTLALVPTTFDQEARMVLMHLARSLGEIDEHGSWADLVRLASK